MNQHTLSALARARQERSAQVEREVPALETMDHCGARQHQMIQRLEKAGYDPHRLRFLKECESNHRDSSFDCSNCTEGCHFGTRSRRLEQIYSGLKLLGESEAFAYQLNVVCPLWRRDPGKLSTFGIAAPRQWLYRRLAAIDGGSLRAVGSIEASLNRELDGSVHWQGEAALIVTGAGREDLACAFRLPFHQRVGRAAKPAMVTGVNDLPRQLAYCLKRFVEERRAYISSRTGRQDRRHLPLSRKHQVEFDTWLLGLPLGARTIAYGCHRHGASLRGRYESVRRTRTKR